METIVKQTSKSWKIILLVYSCGLATVMALAYLDKIQFDFPGMDKIGHFMMIGGASYLAHKALNRKKILKNRIALGPLLVLVFFGIEEYVQQFSPVRSFSISDLGADALGVLFFMMLEKRWPEIGPKWAIDKTQKACLFLYWQLEKLKERA
jgi:hypothetical protein